MAQITYLTDPFFWEGDARTDVWGSQIWGLADGRIVLLQDEAVSLFEADGTRLTEAVTLSEGPLIDVFFGRPTLAELADGGFALAWTGEATDPGVFEDEAFLRVFESDGTPRTDVLPVNPSTPFLAEEDVALAPTPDGFLAVWEENGPVDTDLWVRAFDALGQPLSDGRIVNQTLSGRQVAPDLVTLDGGEIVLSYRSFGTDFGPERGEALKLEGLVVQVLDPDGATLVDETLISPASSGSALDVELAALTGDRVVLAFLGEDRTSDGLQGSDLYARTFEVDRSGPALALAEDGPLIDLTEAPDLGEEYPRVIGTPDGGFFAAWLSPDELEPVSPFEGAVLGRFFGPDGTARTEAAELFAGAGEPRNLSLAARPDGAVTVNWLTEFRPGDDIFATAENGLARTVLLSEQGDTIEGDGLLVGTPGNDRILGGAGNDVLEGREGSDRLEGGGGDDLLRGAAGFDTLQGGDGADGLDGGPGADVLRGAAGDDRYLLDDPGDRAIEAPGEGEDRVYASVDFRVTAEIERVTLLGTDDLRATGNAIAQRLDGNRGDNVLFGRGGSDTMYGGAGDDVFVLDLNVSDAPITILDFSPGDRLAIDDRFFDLGGGSVDPRPADPEEARVRLASDEVEWDRETGEFAIDGAVVAILLEEARLRVEDVLLF
ncbi:calcium-binding protein [Jannaschia seohaensis]|uniref:Hemolysin type calcium-binding protein n=1 Tax=Jannaschia seohaensis TaxID=475081 RepID=A0A2Y9BW40_9RHOB|nr:calcium-binding protein [Jannaschia seohaensis]PWJ22144.1 hemolysin type calcium-binding protein [Jannaschia seohaensis]SSA38422.1 Hemolysin-type calcium-binding repeat-containing protein [Jannaschia seohaensis]